MTRIVNLRQSMDAIAEPWSPVDIALVNDQVVRMALIEGQYHWHKHTHQDELFLVLQGEIAIEVRGETDVVLREGEMAVIPKGTEHRPTSEGPSYILVFEPRALQSRGD
jgi:mannose-6-phosphate isomerase-like protein (cupin superfamily)